MNNFLSLPMSAQAVSHFHLLQMIYTNVWGLGKGTELDKLGLFLVFL